MNNEREGLKYNFDGTNNDLNSKANSRADETDASGDSDSKQYIACLRERIEETLDLYSRLSTDSPLRLTNAFRYSLLAPGKRIRPILTLIATELCGGKIEAALPAGVALECVHAYSLVHDDLPAMDDDDFRRGRPTCHKMYDEATAILAGDALLTYAFEVLASRITDSEVASRCVLALAKAAGPCGMVGGQADDVVYGEVMKKAPMAHDLISELLSDSNGFSEEKSEPSATFVEFLFKVHRRKTGALINAALELGALVAGASDAQLKSLRSYGAALGQAFQISDDILDAVGDEKLMGKRLRKDEEAGKLTYVSLFGLERSFEWLGRMVDEAKNALTSNAALWNKDSKAYDAALYLVDFTARRNK